MIWGDMENLGFCSERKREKEREKEKKCLLNEIRKFFVKFSLKLSFR